MDLEHAIKTYDAENKKLRQQVKDISHYRDLWKNAAKHYRKSFMRLVDEKAEKFGKEAGRWMPRLIEGWFRESEKDERIKELEELLEQIVEFIPFKMHLDYEKNLYYDIEKALQEEGQ